jgi:hypothetical protein
MEIISRALVTPLSPSRSAESRVRSLAAIPYGRLRSASHLEKLDAAARRTTKYLHLDPGLVPCGAFAGTYLSQGDFEMLSLPQPLQLGPAHAPLSALRMHGHAAPSSYGGFSLTVGKFGGKPEALEMAGLLALGGTGGYPALEGEALEFLPPLISSLPVAAPAGLLELAAGIMYDRFVSPGPVTCLRVRPGPARTPTDRGFPTPLGRRQELHGRAEGPLRCRLDRRGARVDRDPLR